MLPTELSNAQKLWYFKIYPEVCGRGSLYIHLKKRIFKNLKYSKWGEVMGWGVGGGVCYKTGNLKTIFYSLVK